MTREAKSWAQLQALTSARVGIGRAGFGIPTAPMLKFQGAYAVARDAVHSTLDVPALERAVMPARSMRAASSAPDRATYLMRPDLGRQLSEESRAALAAGPTGEGCDLVFVIGDGLSPGAAQRYAPDIIARCRRELADLAIGPVVIATNCRVALGDDIAQVLQARAVVVLLGERPGLTVAESLGIYFTWQPGPGTLDSARNCISNVHAGGLSPAVAASTVVWLVREAARRKLSGVALKEDAGGLPFDGTPSAGSIERRDPDG